MRGEWQIIAMTNSRSCPICNAPASAAILFHERKIVPAKLSKFSFASRKEPEFMCHQLVRCPECDLVYADHPPEADELAHAYRLADYDSSAEAEDAALAYVRAIRPVLAELGQRQKALEIGAGTGAFLERLHDEGFSELIGVEPSPIAIAAAPPHRRSWIRETMFEEKDLQPNSFDLICCFMTLEHVRDPSAVASSAMRLLRPGGAFVTVTHDYRSLVNRLLGRRSPIIDIEHLQLFSQCSVRHLLHGAAFRNVSIKRFANSYDVRYWLRLAPLPKSAKHCVNLFLGAIGLERVKLRLNVGNIISVGFKDANA